MIIVNKHLAFKKVLLTEWDGEDYPSFLDYAVAKYQINETGGNETQTMSRQELWDREIEWWGSEKVIKEHWDRYKILKHTYIHCDICDQSKKSNIKNNKMKLIR